MIASGASAQTRRKVIINQDCSGPGGSNMQTLATLIQSPQVEVLGVTIVTGNQWRDEEVVHALRLLEVLGRTDIPVVPGAVFPLVRTREEAQLWQERYGKAGYAGAWDSRWYHEPFVVPPPKEGPPTTKASTEDAAHFLIRMVHKYPHEVTIYEGGPMTNLALALRIDPQFAELAQELVFMGGSLNPATDNPEFVNTPRHEFNFWMDPEAADAVLHANWRKITCTPVDISIRTRLTQAMVDEIAKAGTPLAQYVSKYYMHGPGADFMWTSWQLRRGSIPRSSPSAMSATWRWIRTTAPPTATRLRGWKATSPNGSCNAWKSMSIWISKNFTRCSSA